MSTTVHTEPDLNEIARGKYNPSKYDPMFGFRLPRAVRAGLDVLTQERGVNLSDFVRSKIDVYALYSTERGQDALHALRLAIGVSTTIHKGRKEFQGEHIPDDWNGLDVTKVQPVGYVYTDGTDPIRYIHYVRQCQGETREDAIQNYAEKLWGTWALLDDKVKDYELRQLTDDSKHSYLIAYVGMRTWVQFPTVLEYELWRRTYAPETVRAEPIPEPQNADERAVYDWVVEMAEKADLTAFKSVKKRAGTAGYVLHDPTPDGMRSSYALYLYPDESTSTAVRRWARELTQDYREVTAGNGGTISGSDYIEQHLSHARLLLNVLTIGNND